MCAKYSLPPFDWLKLSHHLVSGESTLHEVTLLKLDREFCCLQPSLARLHSAAASPSERLRSDGSLAIIKQRLSYEDIFLFSISQLKDTNKTKAIS